MTDRELLEALYNNMQTLNNDVQTLKDDMQTLKDDMQTLKDDMQTLKDDVQTLKDDVQTLKDDMQTVKQKVTSLELTLENETNHNIQLLAENHINLVDKLNQAIRVQDKSILYEVQVSGLKARIDCLEKEIQEIKSKIA